MSSGSSSAVAAAASAVTESLPADRIARNLSLHRACESGDYDLVKSLLQSSAGVDTWYEDPNCHNWSCLHFAAESCNPKLVSLLLRHGAIWNAVDANGYTAAQIAWSLNHEKCYRIIFDEGVRQTFLLNALEEHHAQSQDESEDEDELHESEPGPSNHKKARISSSEEQGEEEGSAAVVKPSENGGSITLKPSALDVANSTDAFLATKLRFEKDSLGKTRCLDADNNMVMADWEYDIMALSARLICSNQPSDFSVLNVGFGLGIIDRLIQGYNPGRHVIIEAHPDALAYARELGFGKLPNVELLEGKWEDWIKDGSEEEEDIQRMMQLGQFDAIYWDTYSQDYADIKKFFSCLPNILKGPGSRFSFFHGLAATNPFFYDVYTRISELDLKEIGLTTQWFPMNPEIKEEEWQGVKQKYWTLETYYCPLCKMDVFD